MRYTYKKKTKILSIKYHHFFKYSFKQAKFTKISLDSCSIFENLQFHKPKISSTIYQEYIARSIR